MQSLYAFLQDPSGDNEIQPTVETVSMQNSLLLDGTIEEFTNPANPKRIQFIMNTKTRLAASMGVSLNSVNVNIETQGPPTSSQETGTTGRRRLFGGLSFLASSGTYSTV